jgi:nucleotide-binding universal stress UspA family protein
MHVRNPDKKTFSKILVAIDELKTSTATTDRAIEYAVNIAQDYDAQLVILHVIRADTKQAEANFVKIIEKIHENSYNNRNKSALKIRTDIIASVRIADAVVNYAKDNHIDLIITGTRGRDKLKSMLLGSVVYDVITHAHCPVIVAK